MPSQCQIYLITPPDLGDLGAFSKLLDLTLSAGPVAALQIRLKDVSDHEVADAVAALAPIAQAHGVAVILNDRPDLARALGCDGVHVGQSDMDCAQARKLLGPDMMIGVTCHDSRHLAMEAAEAGADYVAFGAFYPTATKDTAFRPDPDILSIWQETMEIPCVAIGGITLDNAQPLIEAGADFLAISAGVWRHPQGAPVAVTAFNRLILAA